MNDVFVATAWDDYELLDAGNGKKLERFGDWVLIRPEVRANFSPAWSEKDWLAKADLKYQILSATKGRWLPLKKPMPASGWNIGYGAMRFHLKETPFKHIGIFPEQKPNWDFVSSQSLAGQKALNLFAYTGAMSLACHNAGAQTTFVDASKSTTQWAKINAALSGISDIRFIVDDALAFLKREERRGAAYGLISMDPPAYGLAPSGNRWQLEKLLPTLLQRASVVLAPAGILVLNIYSPRVDRFVLEREIKTAFPYTSFDIRQLLLRSATGKEINTGILARVGAYN